MKKYIYLIFLAIIGFFIVDSVFFSENSKKGTYQEIDEWYVGGTLHKSTIAEWKVATDNNKVATCADFIASRNKDIKLDVLKIRARALQTCIDEAVEEHNAADNEKVSTIAALCMVLLDK